MADSNFIKSLCLDHLSKTLKYILTINLPKKSQEEWKPSTLTWRAIEKKELMPSKVYKDTVSILLKQIKIECYYACFERFAVIVVINFLLRTWSTFGHSGQFILIV